MDDDLKDLAFLGEQFTPDDELAIILGMDLFDLKAELIAGKTKRARTIITARLTRKAALRASILDMACRGSSPAQAEAIRMLARIDS